MLPANEYCCGPASISESHWAESALRPIHKFATNIARTWIHGSTDLVEVLFTTPLRDFIVIILPVPEALLPGNRIVCVCTRQWQSKPPHQYSFLDMVCARRAEWPKEGRLT